MDAASRRIMDQKRTINREISLSWTNGSASRRLIRSLLSHFESRRAEIIMEAAFKEE